MGLWEFWDKLNSVLTSTTCLPAWSGASYSETVPVFFFVKWDKTACLGFVITIKGDHYMLLTWPCTWHTVNCQYTWHYDQSSQPSERRWLWKSAITIPSLQNWRDRLRKRLAWSHPANCNRARVEPNHPLLSPEIFASSQPTVLSLS